MIDIYNVYNNHNLTAPTVVSIKKSKSKKKSSKLPLLQLYGHNKNIIWDPKIYTKKAKNRKNKTLHEKSKTILSSLDLGFDEEKEESFSGNNKEKFVEGKEELKNIDKQLLDQSHIEEQSVNTSLSYYHHWVSHIF